MNFLRTHIFPRLQLLALGIIVGLCGLCVPRRTTNALDNAFSKRLMNQYLAEIDKRAELERESWERQRDWAARDAAGL